VRKGGAKCSAQYYCDVCFYSEHPVLDPLYEPDDADDYYYDSTTTSTTATAMTGTSNDGGKVSDT
jgi:hypothetical protein